MEPEGSLPCSQEPSHSLDKLCYFTLWVYLAFFLILIKYYYLVGARSSVVGWGTMLQAGRSRVRFPLRSLDIFNLPNPSSRTMALVSTQSLTEMSTRNLPEGKGRPALKADNLTAICEPIV
jgi:hypothetical protein